MGLLSSPGLPSEYESLKELSTTTLQKLKEAGDVVKAHQGVVGGGAPGTRITDVRSMSPSQIEVALGLEASAALHRMRKDDDLFINSKKGRELRKRRQQSKLFNLAY